MRRLRRLLSKRSLRWSEGACVIEGPDLLEAALGASAHFEALYVDSSQVEHPRVAPVLRRALAQGLRVDALAPDTFTKVSDAVTPQGVMASIRLPLARLEELDVRGLVLVVHDLQDPGNAGTIVRSGAAAGVDAVLFTGHAVDPFNPKALRASAGAVFSVPVVVGELDDVLGTLRERGCRIYASVLNASHELREVDVSGRCAVLIGSEAAGLDAAAREACDDSFRIAMSSGVESLNAGVAASLIAFSAMWQREAASEGARRRSLGRS